jgi:tetratricopeptide (TPR) repeat protein
VKPGDVISRYRIVSRIGKGGMGEVYRAEDTRLERQVALKFLSQDGFTEQSKSRFMNEARAAAKARHPNICPIHDIEEADGELFLVMAYIEGETLRSRIARRPLEAAQTVELAIQIAGGLACAHALGIIHRDIKTGNIMLDPSGQASILDFGLALSPEASRLTEAGAAVGTPAYMSPEQIAGGAVDARTDLWSLGVVMFEMLTGTLPFRRDRSSAIIHAVLNDSVPRLSSLRSGVPPELERVVEKALAKDVAHRWQSATQMIGELQRLGTGSVTPRDVSDTQTIIAPGIGVARRKRTGIVAVAIAAALLIAGGGFAAYRYRSAAAPAHLTAAVMKQVAVLPFEADGDTSRSVADGLSEVLAGALSDAGRLQGLTLIAPSELVGQHVNTAEDARRVYGVDRVLVGKAQRSGDKIGFTVNVLDAATHKSLAERSFIYDPKNPLASRDQAVALTAAMLNVDVHAAEPSRPETGTSNAYSSYIEGRGFLARHDLRGNLDRAISSLSTAVKQDPNYALAYAGLAEAYWRKSSLNGDKQMAALANQHAEHAVQLDGSLAIAHSVLGSVYLDAGRQQDAIREFQKAMDLAPANADAPRRLAEVYNTMGHFKEAEDLYIRSTQARPTDWYGYLLLGIFYYERERYPEAEAALNQAKTLTPDNDIVRIDLGGVYRMHGRYKEAIAEYQQALRIRSSAKIYAALAGAYFYEHRFQEAVSALETATDLDADDYRYWGNLGIYCRWVPGDESKSAPALRHAIEMANKIADTVKSDYAVHANLAEYHARLGNPKAALAEIDKIPGPARGPFTARVATVYELTGQRAKAIAIVRENLKSPASLNQIKNDPDLAALWREGKF